MTLKLWYIRAKATPKPDRSVDPLVDGASLIAITSAATQEEALRKIALRIQRETDWNLGEIEAGGEFNSAAKDWNDFAEGIRTVQGDRNAVYVRVMTVKRVVLH